MDDRSPVRLDYPPPLSPEEFSELFSAYKSGDEEAGKTIVMHNMRWVGAVAQKYAARCTHLQKGDFESVGAMALMTSLQSFDLSRGANFLTYANYNIRKNMQRLLRLSEYEIRIPINRYENVNQFNQTDWAIREPSSLDAPLRMDEDGSLHDKIANPSIDCERGGGDLPDGCESAVASAFARLSARDKMLLGMLYGMDGCRVRKDFEVAKQLNITRQAVLQRKWKAESNLRKLFQFEFKRKSVR